MLNLASASGNTFAYAWERLPEGADGPGWARAVCARLNLDGLFLLERPRPGEPWIMEHWDGDGGRTFCSNGSRAALGLPGAPTQGQVEAISSGEPITLRRAQEADQEADQKVDRDTVAIRMPSGPSTGFRPLPAALADLAGPTHAFGLIGNPQLVIARQDLERLDLDAFAPPLRHHPSLPGGTNINVVQELAPGTARIRSWERGVEGETRCCGTGCAVAGAWLARRSGLLTWRLLPQGDPVTVEVVPADEGWRELWLSGPVAHLGTVLPQRSWLS
jgi:diaminopimelate epimerase